MSDHDPFRSDAATPSALLPLEPHLDRLVVRQQVGPLAWAGMLREGTLVELWDATARRADVPVTAVDRARAVAHLLPRRGVVGRTSAVWVHTGGPAPSRIDVLIQVGVRRPAPHPQRRAAETTLRPDDVEELAGVPVTTLVRTAVDVARWADPEVAPRLLRRLVGHGLDLQDAHARLAEYAGRRRTREAHALLRALAPGSEPAGGVVLGAGSGDAVDVEHALDLAHGGEHGSEVGRLGHLEDEP